MGRKTTRFQAVRKVLSDQKGAEKPGEHRTISGKLSNQLSFSQTGKRQVVMGRRAARRALTAKRAPGDEDDAEH